MYEHMGDKRFDLGDDLRDFRVSKDLQKEDFKGNRYGIMEYGLAQGIGTLPRFCKEAFYFRGELAET